MASALDLLSEVPFEGTFVNRTKELAFLDENAIVAGNTVFLIGAFGLGKTALLRKFVSTHLSRYEGGVVFKSARDELPALTEIAGHSDSESKHRLIIADEADIFKPKELLAGARMVYAAKRDNLIVAGRHLPDSHSRYILRLPLTGIEISKLLEVRLAHIPNAPNIERVLSLLNANKVFFDDLLANPRMAISLTNRLLHASIDEDIGRPDFIQPTERKVGKLPRPDVVSLVLALVLFFFSEHNSKHALETTLQEISYTKTELEVFVKEQIERSNRPANVITSFVNVRAEPNDKADNVLTILAPNQIVYLKGVKEGWAHILYIDPVSKSELNGWVYAAYIKSIE